MTKILTTQNAQITTAAVEVKTLTISGRQVTQSVFRQLREVPLVSDDGTLNGVPWGYVNYHPDKCGDSSIEHLHVVWQHGADLLRCHVDVTPEFDRSYRGDLPRFTSEAGDDFYSACVRNHLNDEDMPYLGGLPIIRTPKGGRQNVQRWRDGVLRDVPITVSMSDEALAAVKASDAYTQQRDRNADAKAEGHGVVEYAQRWESEALESLGTAMEALENSSPDACADLFATFDAEIAEESARRNRHRQVRAALAALPHLFIAV